MSNPQQPKPERWVEVRYGLKDDPSGEKRDVQGILCVGLNVLEGDWVTLRNVKRPDGKIVRREIPVWNIVHVDHIDTVER